MEPVRRRLAELELALHVGSRTVDDEVAGTSRVAGTGTRRWRAVRRVRGGGAAGPLLVALATFVIGGVAYPREFTVFDFNSVVSTAAPIVLLATGMTFVLLAGEIDLSVGSLMSLASVMLATWMNGQNNRETVVIVATVGSCAVIGALNGILVVLGKIPSFIVTLSMLFIIGGINLVWTNGSPPSGLAPSFVSLALAGHGILTTGAGIIVVTPVLASLVLSRTRLGRSLYLIGSNQRAAINTGIPSGLFVTSAFAISGACAGLAGTYATSYSGSGQTTLGSGMELTAIAAAVIGAVSLFGGRGTAVGAAAGGLILALLFNILLLAGTSAQIQPVATGVVLIAGSFAYNRSTSSSPNWLKDLLRLRRVWRVGRAGQTSPEEAPESARLVDLDGSGSDSREEVMSSEHGTQRQLGS